MKNKFVTIFFDFEGQWGMPYKDEYDLKTTTNNLLQVLNKYNFKAVFNTCGVIAKVHPDIIRQFDENGHEIAIHGYVHEHLNRTELQKFELLLEQAENDIIKITGKKPLGFRAPYLNGPDFYNREVYDLFRKRGYKWSSNREIRRIEEIFRPDRLRSNIFSKITDRSHITNSGTGRKLFEILLNSRLILNENIDNITIYKDGTFTINNNSRLFPNINWLLNYKTPFYRNDILEIPVLSPFDLDLMKQTNPGNATDEEQINFTYTMLNKELNSSGAFFNYTFHEWFIGTKNRLELFDKILQDLFLNKSVKVVLAKDLTELIKPAYYE